MISVVLPIYNIHKEHLEQCVFSLCRQIYSNIEILLINDGSKEYIENACLELKNTDQRIRYIPIEHSGVSVARNTGIKNARGEYIAFIDPDDWTDPDYLSIIYQTITEDDSDIAMTGCTVNYPNKEIINPFLMEDHAILKGTEKNRILYQLFGKKICDYYPPEIASGVPWGKIFKTSFIKNNDLSYIPGMKRMQDNVFCLYAFEKAASISYIQSSSYHYRMEYSSASHGYRPSIIDDFELYYVEARKFLDAYNKECLLYDALKMKEVTSFNSYFSFYFFHEKNQIPYFQARNEIIQLIESEPYRSALSSINYSLLTKTEALFVFLLKHKMIYILKILVKIRNTYKIK